MERIRQWLETFGASLADWAEVVFGLFSRLLHATTADHLEGAGVMALILLGPSLLMGLAGGFWEGLRIEWRRYRGLPRVIDGDTLDIRGERIRLFGIDTPELGQPWWDKEGNEHDAGASAREALTSLIAGKRVSVKVLREDKYQRSLAIVKVDGRDVAALWSVKAGPLLRPAARAIAERKTLRVAGVEAFGAAR